MAITRILDVSLLQLPQDIDLPPPGHTVPLSFFDIRWVASSPVKNLFLYPNVTLSSFESLKSSLSSTLPFFHPLAGQLTLFDSSSLSICCSSDTGVQFVEAESDIDVTKFVRGGIAIGITIHHITMDAAGLLRFIDTWCMVHQGKDVADVIGKVMPVHDRSVIAFQGQEEISKWILQSIAPTLPNIPRADNTLESRLEIVRKSFVLGAISIESLKRQVLEKSSTSIPVPSTFQVVTAYLWTCVAKTKGLSNNDELTYLCFVTNYRSILNLPVPSAYTGNCVHGTRVVLAGSILASTNGLMKATITTAQAIEAAKSKPLKGIDELKEYARMPKGLKFFVSGILRLFDADFGWGRPERMETVAKDNNPHVQAFILEGKEKGTIQVSLGLSESEMKVFTNIFMNDLDVATCSRF